LPKDTSGKMDLWCCSNLMWDFTERDRNSCCPTKPVQLHECGKCPDSG